VAIEISDNHPGSDLVFSFEPPFAPTQFEDDATHGMGHPRMKRVDLLVTSPSETWLIEVKDPDNTKIPAAQVTRQRASFRKKMHSGTLYSRELAPKLNDTLVYLTLANRAPANRITYVVLLGLEKLDAPMLLTAQNKLRQLCFLPGPFMKPWPSGFDVIVVNIAAWNKHLIPHSVRRKP
jgi:hypothetical protein